MTKKDSLLIPREQYLSAGVHIGMATRTADMKKFIYKIRPNGLAVLNVGVLDKRISVVANFLSNCKNVLVVSRKENAQEPAKKFAESIKAKSIIGRFMPGSLTNPTYKEFFEPDVILITDPFIDKQSIKEAVQMRIPIIGFADTFNETSYLDIVLPCNNKGKKSVALILWLVAKIMTEKKGEKFEYKPEDFGYEQDERDNRQRENVE